MADLTQAREEIERSHKAILALTGEVERLKARIDAALAIRKEMLDPLWPSLTPDELMTRVEEALRKERD